ncbi:restriction endonuclease subunit S [Planktothrix mougeotii]|uniref:Restriction endonuclease subunit S n=1 Tax=Planktothrix mougeotii LEGE 06226 TaxID=1828728 RepID=A0ABR9U6B6_9CYAN|nr:restriction endonuclease subunit S [Planktothrix mougeotii]MBE9141716.1 restriction endonuclease subunit S [Planktothrix mougeotii LEGE 06226]
MEWKAVKCQDVIDIRDGTHDTPKYVSVGYPLITSKNLKNGLIDFSEVSYISAEDHIAINKRSKVDKGDILLAMIGTIGNPVIVDVDQEFSIKNVALFKLQNSPVDPRFLKYLLESSIVKKQLERETKGGTQKFVSLKVLRNLEIPLPPIASQRRIADILDKADEIIRKRKEAIALTEQLQKSIFLDMFGDPITNPKGWEVRKLGNICTIVRGGSPRPINDYLGGTIPWIKIGDATEGDDIYIHKTAEMIKEEGIKKSRYLEPNTLIFANCGVSLGFARILKIGGCIHDGWLAFYYLNPCINQIFLLKSLNQITQYFRSIAPDGTQPNLNTAIMKNFNIPVPPIDLQEKFENIIEHILKNKIKLKQSLEESENLFNSLLQKAFKGEL